jgi:hypothetical protein
MPPKIVCLALFAAITLPCGRGLVYAWPCQPVPAACHRHAHLSSPQETHSPEAPPEKTKSHECCVARATPALPVFSAPVDAVCFSNVVDLVRASLMRDLDQPIVAASYRSEAPPGVSPLRI